MHFLESELKEIATLLNKKNQCFREFQKTGCSYGNMPEYLCMKTIEDFNTMLIGCKIGVEDRNLKDSEIAKRSKKILDIVNGKEITQNDMKIFNKYYESVEGLFY